MHPQSLAPGLRALVIAAVMAIVPTAAIAQVQGPAGPREDLPFSDARKLPARRAHAFDTAEQRQAMADLEAQREAEAAARLVAEAERKRKAEETERLAAEAERVAAEAEAQRRIEDAQRVAAGAEFNRKAEEAQRLAAAAEAQRKAEEDLRLVAEAEAQRMANEAEAKRKASDDQRIAAEADAQRLADEERRLTAEAETKRIAAEADAQRKADEERRLTAEAESKRLAAEAETNRSADAVQRAAAEAEAARKADEAQRVAAEIRRRANEALRVAAEAELRRRAEAARQAASVAAAVSAAPPSPTCGDTNFTAEAMAGGRASFRIDDICRAGQPWTVRYGSIEFVRRLDSAGRAEFTLDLFQGLSAPISVEFGDGRKVPVDINVPDLERVSKIAVVWQGADLIDLHAYEYAAIHGGPGHVWREQASTVEAAYKAAGASGRGRGFITFMDDGVGSAGPKVQVYTFWHVAGQPSGAITMALDYVRRSTGGVADRCTDSADGQLPYTTYAMDTTGAVRREQRILPLARCDGPVPVMARYQRGSVPDLRIKR